MNNSNFFLTPLFLSCFWDRYWTIGGLQRRVSQKAKGVSCLEIQEQETQCRNRTACSQISHRLWWVDFVFIVIFEKVFQRKDNFILLCWRRFFFPRVFSYWIRVNILKSLKLANTLQKIEYFLKMKIHMYSITTRVC